MSLGLYFMFNKTPHTHVFIFIISVFIKKLKWKFSGFLRQNEGVDSILFLIEDTSNNTEETGFS